MKIILVNDDGIRSPGIWALADGLKGEHELVVAAPENQRSGFSHAITIHTAVKARAYPAEGVRAYEIAGTPADCTMLARGVFMPDVDLVISGINRGYNAGGDVHYSGTVSAAAEAAMYGVPAIAVSANEETTDFEPAIMYTKALIEYIQSNGLPRGDLLNLNLPNGVPKGLRYAPTGRREYIMDYKASDAGDGWTVYNSHISRLPVNCEGTDLTLLDAGYATVTRLTTEWTAGTLDGLNVD